MGFLVVIVVFFFSFDIHPPVRQHGSFDEVGHVLPVEEGLS
jgi:hypothetical protein